MSNNHKVTREGDEYACVCGLRWDINEDDPHQPVTIGFDPSSGEDRSVVNGHVLYKPSDFTSEEINSGNKLAQVVIEGDLQVCMKCGEYESGLNTPCKKVNNVSE